MRVDFPRLFTREQAEALLPTLQPLVARMMAADDRIQRARPALDEALRKAGPFGGSRAEWPVVEAMDALRLSVEAIQALGVLVKDVQAGLLDFPTLRDGEVAFLCWKAGEAEVGYWHEVQSGFAGRKRLDPD